MPITWKNVVLQESDSASLLSGASKAFDTASTQLNSVFDSRTDIAEAGLKETKKQNTNAYLDTLQSATSVDQLESAETQQALTNIRAGAGDLIDSDTVRDAQSARFDSIVSKEQKDYERDQRLATEEFNPIESRISELVNTKDFDGARELLDQNRGLAIKIGKFDDWGANIVTESRAEETYLDQKLTRDSKKSASTATELAFDNPDSVAAYAQVEAAMAADGVRPEVQKTVLDTFAADWAARNGLRPGREATEFANFSQEQNTIYELKKQANARELSALSTDFQQQVRGSFSDTSPATEDVKGIPDAVAKMNLPTAEGGLGYDLTAWFGKNPVEAMQDEVKRWTEGTRYRKQEVRNGGQMSRNKATYEPETRDSDKVAGVTDVLAGKFAYEVLRRMGQQDAGMFDNNFDAPLFNSKLVEVHAEWVRNNGLEQDYRRRVGDINNDTLMASQIRAENIAGEDARIRALRPANANE